MAAICWSRVARSVMLTLRNLLWPTIGRLSYRSYPSARKNACQNIVQCVFRKLSIALLVYHTEAGGWEEAWRGLPPPNHPQNHLLIGRQPIAVGRDQVVDQRPDLIEAQLGGGVRVEHRGVIDMLALAGQRGLDGQ